MKSVHHSVFAAVVKRLTLLQNRLGSTKKALGVLVPGRVTLGRHSVRILCLALVVVIIAIASPSARHSITGLASSYARYENSVSAQVSRSWRKTQTDLSAPQLTAYAANVEAMPILPLPPPPDPPPVFSDDPLVAGVTVVQALHINQLRDAVNQVRARAGLSAASWAESVAAGGPIKAAHILELRARLDEARTALGLPSASYSDPPPSIGG